MLPLAWTYIIKDEHIKKACGTCNGGKIYGCAVILAHTYDTSCIEQPTLQMFWSLAALNGMMVIRVDAGNAFAPS